MNQIAGVMNLDAWKPLERRRCDVAIVAHANNRRIGIEAWQDGITNAFSHDAVVWGSCTTVQRTTAPIKSRNPRQIKKGV